MDPSEETEPPAKKKKGRKEKPLAQKIQSQAPPETEAVVRGTENPDADGHHAGRSGTGEGESQESSAPEPTPEEKKPRKRAKKPKAAPRVEPSEAAGVETTANIEPNVLEPARIETPNLNSEPNTEPEVPQEEAAAGPKEDKEEKNKKGNWIGIALAAVMAMGAATYISWPTKTEKAPRAEIEKIQMEADKPNPNAFGVRAAEANAATTPKEAPVLINTPTPGPTKTAAATPDPSGKQIILDIRTVASLPNSRFILTTLAGSDVLIVVETKNPKLVEIIDKKEIAPGTKINLEADNIVPSTELLALAKTLKAAPKKMKRIEVRPE